MIIEKTVSRENRPLDIDVLGTFVTAMLEMHRLDDLLWGIVTTIGRTLQWDDCVLYLREGQSLRQIAAYGSRNPPNGALNAPVTIPLGHGITGIVGRAGKAEVIVDTQTDERNSASPCGGRAKLVVPIVYDDSVLGVIDCEAPESGYFDAADLHLISAIAGVAAPKIAADVKNRHQRDAVSPSREPIERVDRQAAELSQAVSRLQLELADRRSAETQLNVKQSLLAGMLNAQRDGLIGVNDLGQIDYVNDAAVRILKATTAGLTGFPLDEACDVRDAVTNAALPFSSLKLANASRPTQVFIRHGEGEGTVVSLLVSQRDITLGGFTLSLRDLATDAETQNEAAKIQRLESLGLLAAGIGHDFNNLLAAILSSSEAIVLDDTLSATVRELAGTIEQSALQGRELSQQLLTFARGGAPLLGEYDLSEVVRSAVNMAMMGQAAAVELSLEDNICAQFDRGQITQVIQNVVLNAAQASTSGDVVKVMTRRVLSEGVPYAHIVVRDTGRGIPRHQIKRVLDPFFTTKQKGTGMGLAVSYGIIKRHNGSIDIYSEPGMGTEITIRLPAVAHHRTDSEPQSVQVETASSGCRVLVVDDQRAVRLALTRMLEVLGCDVLEAEDSQGALEQARLASQMGNPVEVAFLDLTMPGDHGGQSLTGPLREIDRDIKTVAFSGYAVDPIMSEYQSYGFDARLAKPFTRTELTAVLREIQSESVASLES